MSFPVYSCVILPPVEVRSLSLEFSLVCKSVELEPGGYSSRLLFVILYFVTTGSFDYVSQWNGSKT